MSKTKKDEKSFINIRKLECDYTVYKKEREEYKMPVVEKCIKCGKKFKEGNELYLACMVDNDKEEHCIICKECANITQ